MTRKTPLGRGGPNSRLLLVGLGYMENLPPGRVLALTIAMVGVIGLLDFATGYEAYFGFVYLLPVSLATWYVGSSPGLLLALLSSMVWLVANQLAGADYSQFFILLWNVLSRALVLVLCAMLLSNLRTTVELKTDLAERIRQSLKTQRRLNRLLRERLQAIEQIAAGVAHEVRNPLGTLVSGTEYLARRARSEPEQELLKDMQTAVAHADVILQDLLDFSAPLRLNVARASLADAVRQATSEAGRRAEAAGIALQAGNLPLVEIGMDLRRIVQVLVNLLHNAIDASPRGGSVRVGMRVASSLEFDVDEMEPAAKIAVIEVDDDGPGIRTQDLNRVFDPFFTTKAPGAGTGLGLSVSRRIVDDHGGLLRLENRAAGGVRATLLLPIGEP